MRYFGLHVNVITNFKGFDLRPFLLYKLHCILSGAEILLGLLQSMHHGAEGKSTSPAPGDDEAVSISLAFSVFPAPENWKLSTLQRREGDFCAEYAWDFISHGIYAETPRPDPWRSVLSWYHVPEHGLYPINIFLAVLPWKSQKKIAIMSENKASTCFQIQSWQESGFNAFQQNYWAIILPPQAITEEMGDPFPRSQLPLHGSHGACGCHWL